MKPINKAIKTSCTEIIFSLLLINSHYCTAKKTKQTKKIITALKKKKMQKQYIPIKILHYKKLFE